MRYYIIYNGELYHHGVKGMKWGVRRFQKKDGTLTPAGKKRYSDNSPDGSAKKVSVHRRRLEEKYRAKGMSAAEARHAADKRIKVEKIIGGAAAVTVTACAAYYAKNKIAETYCDQVLKKGTTFHNLHSVAEARPGEHLYVNYRQNDKHFFRGHFAVGKLKQTGHVFEHVIEAKEDVKIPSINTRKSVFKQLYDGDDTFRKAINLHSHIDVNNTNSKTAYKSMWQLFGDKNNPAFNDAKKKYFEALRQKGYDAIVDEWDSSPRVFRSDAPLILLNTSSKSLGEMSIRELTAKEILVSQANSKWYAPTRTMKTVLDVPHTNHFKESSRHLSRYAAKNAKNSEYIDRVLKESKSLNILAVGQALNNRGSTLSDAGKYLTKYKGMTYEKAMKLATAKNKAENTAKTVATLSAAGVSAYAPIYALDRGVKTAYARNYIKNHPNTKLTVKEIEDMYSSSGRSSTYKKTKKSKY